MTDAPRVGGQRVVLSDAPADSSLCATPPSSETASPQRRASGRSTKAGAATGSAEPVRREMEQEAPDPSAEIVTIDESRRKKRLEKKGDPPRRKKRSKRHKRHVGRETGLRDDVEELVDLIDLYQDAMIEAAALVEDEPPPCGRPLTQPAWANLFWVTVVQYCGSNRAAERRLRSMWPELRAAVQKRYGRPVPGESEDEQKRRESLLLPEKPMTRKQFSYWFKTRLEGHEDLMAEMRKPLRGRNVELAQQAGVCKFRNDSYTDPSLDNLVFGDLQLLPALRFDDPGGDWHKDGGGEWDYGTRHVSIVAAPHQLLRDPDQPLDTPEEEKRMIWRSHAGEQFVLDVIWDSSFREAEVAVESVLDLHGLLPNMQGLVYDMVHHTQTCGALLSDGLIPFLKMRHETRMVGGKKCSNQKLLRFLGTRRITGFGAGRGPRSSTSMCSAAAPSSFVRRESSPKNSSTATSSIRSPSESRSPSPPAGEVRRTGGDGPSPSFVCTASLPEAARSPCRSTATCRAVTGRTPRSSRSTTKSGRIASG
ncbi:MAG: hypothetical protein ACYDBS_10145 [Acidimicrobiales bacterium]